MEGLVRIEPASGRVDFPGGALSSHSTRDEFERLATGRLPAISVSNPPWVTRDLRLDEAFVASVVFHGSNLCEIRLMKAARDEPDSPWTEEGERLRRLAHDRWLERQIGKAPYRFPWGTVESVYDDRANCSVIIVRYARGTDLGGSSGESEAIPAPGESGRAELQR